MSEGEPGAAPSAKHRRPASATPLKVHTGNLTAGRNNNINIFLGTPHRKPGAVDDDVPSLPLSAVNKALPAAPARNFGREVLANGLARACLTADAFHILVLGGPGLGKTTLTSAVATHPDVVAKFGHRRWFVELDTADEARKLETGIAAALGLDLSLPFEAVLAQLGEAPGMLVLDNLETPFWQQQAQTESLLRRLAGVAGVILVASVRDGEPPRGVRWRQQHLEPLEEVDARKLFLNIAARIPPDDPHLALFLADLGGMPLAIELVALRAAPRQRLAELWREWTALGTTLAERLNDSGSRLDSLARSFDLSLRSVRITETGRRLFGLLGQLPSGIAALDLDALLGGAAGRGRAELLATGLAYDRADRLDLLPPVRDHSRRAYPPGKADTDLWVRHYLALAAREGARCGIAGGREAAARLLPESGNLELALLAGIHNPYRSAALDATFGFTHFLRFTGAASPAPLHMLAAVCRTTGDRLGEANCVKRIADVALRRSDHATAQKSYEIAMPLYQSVGDVVGIVGEANCIKGLGDLALACGEYGPAQDAYKRALPLYRKVNNVRGAANVILRLGDIAVHRSKYAKARAAYQQAVPMFQIADDMRGEANCILHLGDIAFHQADYTSAQAEYERALPMHFDVGDVLGQADCIRSLGEVARKYSNHAAARMAYELALPLYRQVGSLSGEANCLQGLNAILANTSDQKAAGN